MTIPETQLETGRRLEPGYRPALDFHGRPVATLRRETFSDASTLHHAVMSEDAHTVLFERTEKSRATSDYAELSEAQLESLRAQLRF